MSSLPVPYRGAALARTERRAAREIAQIRGASSVIAAREAAKIEVLAEVTSTALLSAAEVSSIEALLVARTPHAAGRLAYVADRGCMAMGEVVIKTARRL